MPNSAASKGRAAGRAASPRAKSPPPAPSPLVNPSFDNAESKEIRPPVVLRNRLIYVITFCLSIFLIVFVPWIFILVGLCAIPITFCLFLYRGTLKSIKQSKRKARTNFDLQPSLDPLQAKLTPRMSFWRAETENVFMPMCYWVIAHVVLPLCILALIVVYYPVYKDFSIERSTQQFFKLLGMEKIYNYITGLLVSTPVVICIGLVVLFRGCCLPCYQLLRQFFDEYRAARSRDYSEAKVAQKAKASVASKL
jgi:hypothetical protein